MAHTVTGIDVDRPSLSRARHRVAQFANAAVEHTSFAHFDPGAARQLLPGASIRRATPPSPVLPISAAVAQLRQLKFLSARHRI